MIFKDSAGRMIEVFIEGTEPDDIQVSEAKYLDSDEEVSDDEIDFVLSRYASEISEEWFMIQVMKTESRYEGDR